jgi:hypothetical protein
MARKPDVPCAGGCGTLLWGGSTSLPAGERCCRSCRAKGLAPRVVDQSRRRSSRTCDLCDAKHFARGMCRNHYYRDRWAAGLDGSSAQGVTLSAVCHRWATSAPKVKAVSCQLTVGIMPSCPMCDALMSPLSAHHFICRSCWTDAEFNPEEVSWLATSAKHSTIQSRPIGI